VTLHQKWKEYGVAAGPNSTPGSPAGGITRFLNGRDGRSFDTEVADMTAPDRNNPRLAGTRQHSRAGPPKNLLAPQQPGILAVDDKWCVRGLLDEGLRQQGFALWLAADGQEALDLYQQHARAIDVALLDVRMPDLDGPQTLAALREINPHVCCGFMSGDLGRYTERELYDLGAAAVIRKPFRLADVARVLGELAGRADRQPAGA
jgi:CheY-like chemotaxis protein